MAPHLTLTSLLLVFAAGMTAQVHAADQQASTLSREACALVRHDIDAVPGVNYLGRSTSIILAGGSEA